MGDNLPAALNLELDEKYISGFESDVFYPLDIVLNSLFNNGSLDMYFESDKPIYETYKSIYGTFTSATTTKIGSDYYVTYNGTLKEASINVSGDGESTIVQSETEEEQTLPVLDPSTLHTTEVNDVNISLTVLVDKDFRKLGLSFS